MVNRKAKLAFLFLLLALSASGLFRLSARNNPDLPEVYAYIRENKSIEARFGIINDMRVRKITNVYSSQNAPAYRLYQVGVEGARNSGVVEILTLTQPDGIKSIKERK